MKHYKMTFSFGIKIILLSFLVKNYLIEIQNDIFIMFHKNSEYSNLIYLYSQTDLFIVTVLPFYLHNKKDLPKWK